MGEQELLSGEPLKNKLIQGVKTLANAVKVTLGPSGLNVALDINTDTPRITKDGVSVAKAVHLNDTYANLGATLVKEASIKTNKEVGDSTTTTIILAEAFIEELSKIEIHKLGINNIKNIITPCIEDLLSYLDNFTNKVESSNDIYNIAKVASNHDVEIAEMLSKSYDNLGNALNIRVEKSKNENSNLQIIEGIPIPSGYTSNLFVNNDKDKCILEDCYVALFNTKLDSIYSISNILNYILQNNKSILIIAKDFSQDFMNEVSLNSVRNGLKICLVKAPYYANKRNNFLTDIQLLLNTEIIDSMSLNNINNTDSFNKFGIVSKAIITKDNCLILGNNYDKDAVKKRISILTDYLLESTDEFEQKEYKESIALLEGKAAIMSIGSNNQYDISERIDRAEDAICAVKSALKYGYVSGGAMMYQYLSSIANKFKESSYPLIELSYSILHNVLQVPLRQLVYNCSGDNYNEIVKKMIETDFEIGYNFSTNIFSELKSEGIVESVNSIITSIKNAMSIAFTIMSLECAIYNENAL